MLNTSRRAHALGSFQISRPVLRICMATFSWRPYRQCDPTCFALLRREGTRRMVYLLNDLRVRLCFRPKECRSLNVTDSGTIRKIGHGFLL